MSSSTDKTQLESLISIVKEKQNKLTAGEGITIENDTISSAGGDDFYNGSNSVSSISSIPTTKSLVIASISSDETLSLDGSLESGQHMDIIIRNTSSSRIVISYSDDFVAIGDSSLLVYGDSSLIVHIDYDGSLYYAHACDEGKSDGVDLSRSVAEDVVLYDEISKSKVIISPDDLNINLYPLSRYTPIGIMVIPPSHNVYGNGEGAMVSLAEMNCSTPDTGSTSSYQYIYWGYNNLLLGDALTTFPKTGTTAEATTEVTASSSYNYLPSDNFSGGSCPTDLLAFYYNSSTWNAGPSPYYGDGRNPAYYQTTDPMGTTNALNDFNGLLKTQLMLDAVTASDWQTSSTISNSCSSGNYPSACCCWRYSTKGTSQGDWYLPAEGELGYLCARLKTINNSITTLNSVYGTVGSIINTSHYYWSSTEYSASSAQNVYMGNGCTGYYGKTNSLYVRAFARV